MKKFGSLALAALIVTALGVSASAASFEAAAGTPTIDGKKDNAYASAGIDINLTEADGSKATTGATGVAYTAWDNDYLYVYVEVTDSVVTPAESVTSVWQNDSVEIYVNLAGTEGAIADINAAQYTYGPSFTAIAGGGLHRTNNVDNVKKAFTYTDKGYTIEVAIPWGSDYTAKADAEITFALGVNDNADTDPLVRTNHVFTGKGQANAWSKADSTWDTLKLSTTKYTAPATDDGSSAATADMGIVAALAALAASGAAVLSLKKRK